MLKKIQKSITQSQVWKSIFRVGIPTDNRKRALAMLGNVVLHLHPIKVKKSGLRMSYTWCMGGTAFFLFLTDYHILRYDSQSTQRLIGKKKKIRHQIRRIGLGEKVFSQQILLPERP